MAEVKEAGLKLFQSTLPRRERRWRTVVVRRNKVISIHAPAKGATGGRGAAGGLVSDFNPRSREGSDYVSGPARLTQGHFNPRSREGSDCIY